MPRADPVPRTHLTALAASRHDSAVCTRSWASSAKAANSLADMQASVFVIRVVQNPQPLRDFLGRVAGTAGSVAMVGLVSAAVVGFLVLAVLPRVVHLRFAVAHRHIPR